MYLKKCLLILFKDLFKIFKFHSRLCAKSREAIDSPVGHLALHNQIKKLNNSGKLFEKFQLIINNCLFILIFINFR